MSTISPRRAIGPARRAEVQPVLFVIDHDPVSLEVLLSDLSRRFGKDFTLRGESSPEVALYVLEELSVAEQPVALLFVDDAALGILARAHKLHPAAKRVLLVDRDYTSSSPAVQAIMLGQADYHLVRPWADDENAYRAMSDYLSSWASEQSPRFEEFQIVASEGDSRAGRLRDVMTRFSMPFGFYEADSARLRSSGEVTIESSACPTGAVYAHARW